MENTNTNNMPAVVELPEETFAMQLAHAQSVEGSMWTNYVMETEDDKIKFFSAITQPDKKLSEVINVPFKLTAVYCDTAKTYDEKTGEEKVFPRCILFNDKGESYATGSICIFGDLQKLFSFVGYPTKEKPIKVVIKQEDKGSKRYYHIGLAK